MDKMAPIAHLGNNANTSDARHNDSNNVNTSDSRHNDPVTISRYHTEQF